MTNIADELRYEYDFSAARANPYGRRLKRRVTIRLDVDAVEHFEAMAGRTGVPCQSLINLYLVDCAANGRELALSWV
ncbi:MAG: BrnA antitoxin family protein [Propionibacteriaceae bacterium]|nr:BrnA antitoxin family protein [Propionibacteriaceae bacterium]